MYIGQNGGPARSPPLLSKTTFLIAIKQKLTPHQRFSSSCLLSSQTVFQSKHFLVQRAIAGFKNLFRGAFSAKLQQHTHTQCNVCRRFTSPPGKKCLLFWAGSRYAYFCQCKQWYRTENIPIHNTNVDLVELSEWPLFTLINF